MVFHVSELRVVFSMKKVMPMFIAKYVLPVLLLLLFMNTFAFSADTVSVWMSSEDLSRKLSEEAPLPIVDAATAQEDRFLVKVDLETPGQEILGLGSSFEHTTCYNLFQLGPALMAETLEKLVCPEKGIGMNLMRICIGTPDFTGEPWYSYNDMPPGETDPELNHFSIEKDQAYVLPVLKKALEINPNLLFFASPWSPPGWMTSTDDMIGGHLLPQYYGVYAEYFVKFIQAYAAEGIPVHAVTPQNEPGVNTRNYPMRDWYPSCQWSLIVDEDNFWPVDYDAMGVNERNFIRDHLGPAFERHGLKTLIWCYDHNFNNLWYPRNILKDADAARYVDGTGFHGYAGSPKDLAAFQGEFPDKALYFTEGAAPGLNGASRIANLFRNGCRSYNSWVIMIDYEGNPNNGPFKTKRTAIQPRRDGQGVDYHFTYYSYGQFMKFLQRGARYLGSTEGTRRLTHAAFLNPDGRIVLVAVNLDREAAPVTIAWKNRRFDADIPAKTVATFVWQP